MFRALECVVVNGLAAYLIIRIACCKYFDFCTVVVPQVSHSGRTCPEQCERVGGNGLSETWQRVDIEGVCESSKPGMWTSLSYGRRQANSAENRAVRMGPLIFEMPGGNIVCREMSNDPICHAAAEQKSFIFQ